MKALLTVALLVTALLAWTNGAVVRWTGKDEFFGPQTRGDELLGCGGCLAAAVVLLVALIAARVLRQPTWLLLVLAGMIGTQLGLAAASHHWAGQLTAAPNDGQGVGDGVAMAFGLPGFWPLGVVLLVAIARAVRGSSYPGPRSQPDP